MGGHAEKKKISPHLAARLDRLEPGELVRAVVMPARPAERAPVEVGTTRRTRRTTLKEAMHEARRLAGQAFDDIDACLDRTGGRRVTQQANPLGFIVVEATGSGIEAIIDLDWVAAVLEDQPIHPIQ
jgi:hypothetical protein